MRAERGVATGGAGALREPGVSGPEAGARRSRQEEMEAHYRPPTSEHPLQGFPDAVRDVSEAWNVDRRRGDLLVSELFRLLQFHLLFASSHEALVRAPIPWQGIDPPVGDAIPR